MPSSPFHIHAILKLAPVLSQLSEKMHMVRTSCSAVAKTKYSDPHFLSENTLYFLNGKTSAEVNN